MNMQIDFLPQQYHRRRQQRRARSWWMLVLVMTVATIASTSLAQWNSRRSVEAEIAQLAAKRQLVLGHHQSLAALQKELSEARDLASLYTFLEHPWPRSSVMTAIVKPLPESLRIQSLSFQTESRPTKEVEEVVTRSRSNKAKPKKLAPAKADLENLWGHASNQNHFVHLSGEAQDIALLHRFVDQLARHPLIQSASLKSLGASHGDKGVSLARFDVRLQLAPAWGMDGGPHQQQVSLINRSIDEGVSEREQRLANLKQIAPWIVEAAWRAHR